MKYDQEKTNELAVYCQENNLITQELFDAVKFVAYARLKRTPIPQPLYDGYITLCIDESLAWWDKDAGGAFTIAVHLLISHQIIQYDRKDSKVVHIPKTALSITSKKGVKIADTRAKHVEMHPDTMLDESGQYGNFWDTLINEDEEDDSNTELIGVMREAVLELPDDLQELYEHVYIQERTQSSYGRLKGVCRETVRKRTKKIESLLKKKMQLYISD